MYINLFLMDSKASMTMYMCIPSHRFPIHRFVHWSKETMCKKLIVRILETLLVYFSDSVSVIRMDFAGWFAFMLLWCCFLGFLVYFNASWHDSVIRGIRKIFQEMSFSSHRSSADLMNHPNIRDISAVSRECGAFFIDSLWVTPQKIFQTYYPIIILQHIHYMRMWYYLQVMYILKDGGSLVFLVW